MVQAAAISGIDFAAANPRCRYWWLKTRWILDRIEDMNTLKLFDMQHRQHVSIIDYQIERQMFDSHWNAANELLNKSFTIDFPWVKDVSQKKRQKDIDTLMDQWKQRFGDPNDPAVQERFLNLAKEWRRQGDESKKNQFSDARNLNEKLKKLNANRGSSKKVRGK